MFFRQGVGDEKAHSFFVRVYRGRCDPDRSAGGEGAGAAPGRAGANDAGRSTGERRARAAEARVRRHAQAVRRAAAAARAAARANQRTRHGPDADTAAGPSGAAAAGSASAAAAAPTASSKVFNPDISVIGNFVAAGGKNDVSPTPPLQLSEVEASFQAVIDPYAKADFFLTFGPEGAGVKNLGAMYVDRFLHTAMFYPANYGFIPHTLSEDGDPVDCMVIAPTPVAPGAVVRAQADRRASDGGREGR